MKKLFAAAIFGVLVSLVAVRGQAFAGDSAPSAGAGSKSSTAAPAGASQSTAAQYPDLGPDHPSYYKGLWREGKAVDTDWKALDFLWGEERYKRGYRPEQPMKYNLQVHIEKNQMECQYCHSGVTTSGFATLPSVDLCMGCHKSVMTESPEIKKLKEYYDKGQPVPWNPVNNLPEHAQFNHKRHLKAGVTCQSCHGMVQKMAVVERMSSFKMGWCVSCHRDNGASIDCAVCHY